MYLASVGLYSASAEQQVSSLVSRAKERITLWTESSVRRRSLEVISVASVYDSTLFKIIIWLLMGLLPCETQPSKLSTSSVPLPPRPHSLVSPVSCTNFFQITSIRFCQETILEKPRNLVYEQRPSSEVQADDDIQYSTATSSSSSSRTTTAATRKCPLPAATAVADPSLRSILCGTQRVFQ